MKISLNWLESYFVDKPDWDLVLDRLTHAGIEVEGLDNGIAELKITPNRGDCLSVVGLLREISALTAYKYKTIEVPQLEYSSIKKLDINVTIDDKVACPNYTALTIVGVNNQAILPGFILERILNSGFRSVSPIVDIANYVMLELGQPLHTFDLDKVGARLVVRFAHDEENLKLIDETEALISNDTLVIADGNDKVVAIAGVMGSLDSEVKPTTQNIILESAFFNPQIIVGKAKQYGVSSDAAYRFERGVDTNIQEHALLHAADFITKYLGGTIGQLACQKNSDLIPVKSLVIKFSNFNTFIGVLIDNSDICKILSSLGFKILAMDADYISLLVPSFRFDINIKEDIIEEVARVYGYENIPANLPHSGYTMQNINPAQLKIDNIKSQLVSCGYNEIISYAFLEDSYSDLFKAPGFDNISLKNPIAGLSTMRSTLFAGLIKTLQYNINRGADSVKIFELARVFYAEDAELQPLKLSGLVYGNINKVNWVNSKREADFFDIKGDVERLLYFLGEIKFITCIDYPILHSGRCAKIYACDKQIGIIGQLHPLVGQELSLDILPYMFELDVNALINNSFNFEVKAVSKFQKVERDLAFVVDESLNVGVLTNCIKSLRIDNLCQLDVFDIYRGTNVLNGCKSVAIKLIFQATKTLTDEEVGTSLSYIIQQVEQQLQIKLR
jgi:phenylalanyl-tRNA synthetase beta chain